MIDKNPPQGTPHLRYKVPIPWDDIPGVCTLLEEGKTIGEIADFFGVSSRSIYRVIKINDPVRREQIEERGLKMRGLFKVNKDKDDKDNGEDGKEEGDEGEDGED